jgi:hypothetical protein
MQAWQNERVLNRTEHTMPGQDRSVIDYRQSNAASALLPNPPVLSSSGWSHLHHTKSRRTRIIPALFSLFTSQHSSKLNPIPHDLSLSFVEKSHIREYR